MADTFYKDSVATNTYVSFRVLDEKDAVILEHVGYSCFSPITYAPIAKHARTIHVYRKLSTIPYDLPVIKRWIKELNELGFPCEVEQDAKDKETLNFYIRLGRFDRKMHLNCTLQLVRCLFESYICYVPEHYFSLINKETSRADKFIALQVAHKEIANHERSRFANWNHMVTSMGANHGSENISSLEFFKKINNLSQDVYGGHTSLSELWRGAPIISSVPAVRA